MGRLKKTLAFMTKSKLFTVKVVLIVVFSTIFALWLPYFKGVLLGLPDNFNYQIDVVTSQTPYDESTDTYLGKRELDSSISYIASDTKDDKLFIDGSFITRDNTGLEIFRGNRSFAINKETFENLSGYGDRDRYGYLFSPRDTTKDSFIYWHIIYDQPVEMKFKNEEDTLGLKTYHYEASFTSDVTGNLAEPSKVEDGLGVSADIKLETWVEPTSGVLVKYHDELDGYVYDVDSGQVVRPWGKLDSSYSFESVVNRVNLAEAQRNVVFMVVTFVPSMLVVLITGLVMLCVADLRKIYRWDISRYTIMSVAAVLTVSFIELIACLTGTITVIRLFGTSAGMHGVTSLSFILLISMMMLSIYKRKSKLWRGIIMLLLYALIVVSILNISGNIFGLGIVITGDFASVSPTTSLCFLLSSITLLLYLSNQKSLFVKKFCVVLLGAVVLVGVISVFSTAYAISIFQESIWFKAMSVPTAVLFLLSSLAIWGSCRWKMREKYDGIKLSAHLAVLFVSLSLLVVGIAWRGAIESVNSRNVTQFESDTNKLESLITRRLDSYIGALYGARSLFSSSDNVSRSEWKSYVDGIELSGNYPGNQGIGYSLVVPASEKEAVEKSIRDEGFKDFHITPADPARDPYTTIVFLEPFDYRNQRSFGYDMFTDPKRREAMERSRDEGRAAMSGRVTLLQETSQDIQAGFLIYIPFYGKGVDISSLTLQQRRDNIKGYVYSPIRMNDFMQAAVGDQITGVSVKVYDTDDEALINDENLIFNSDLDTYGNPEYSKFDRIETAGRYWIMEYSSLPGYVSGVSNEFPNYVLIGGILASFLLGAAIFGLSSSRQRALNLANQITKDLKKERNAAIRLKDEDEAVIQNIGDGLVLFNADGAIERINHTAENLLGIKEEDVIGKKYDVLRAMDSESEAITESKRPEARVLEGESCKNINLKYQRKDGSYFSSELSLEPIFSKGRVIGAVEVFRDVTEKEALNQAKDDFISLASHQLRTPLTANKWFLELLIAGDVAGKLKPKQLDLAKKVEVSNEHLIYLVTALLNVTRIESGRLTIDPHVIDVGDFVKDIVEGLQSKLDERSQKIEIGLPKEKKITMDDNLIRQVFVNLLTNSMKYSPDGRDIAIDITREKDHMLCSIKDNGYGIPKNQQKNIFTKFFRADNVASKVPNGNGLGLYLVKKIIETSGGKIWFESVEDKGTTFCFTLPLKGVKPKKGEVTLEEGNKL